MNKRAVTLTIIAKMTSNYGESLGNISSVQKVYIKGKAYAIRSRESLKNAIMVQSNMYDDLEVSINGAAQKLVSKEKDATNCKALEGGYMNTSDNTYVRKSSFYVTDAVSCDEFINETRFHNNLHLATTYAKQNEINLQKKSKECGLMPYQYEYDKSLKIYSMTIDLDMIGKDESFDNKEASNEERAKRVIALLRGVENLALVVKGNLDNAEPLFVVGGLTNRKTHYFENVVNVKENELIVTEDLKNRIENGCMVGFLEGGNFKNEGEIKAKLNPQSVSSFFNELEKQVKANYGV